MDASAKPADYTGQLCRPCGYGMDCRNEATRSVNGGWMCDKCHERYLAICQDMKSRLGQNRAPGGPRRSPYCVRTGK